MTAALVPSEEAAEQPNTVDYSICTIVFSAEQMNFYTIPNEPLGISKECLQIPSLFPKSPKQQNKCIWVPQIEKKVQVSSASESL